MDVSRTNMMVIEKAYRIKIPEAEIAHLTKMFLENKIRK